MIFFLYKSLQNLTRDLYAVYTAAYCKPKYDYDIILIQKMPQNYMFVWSYREIFYNVSPFMEVRLGINTKYVCTSYNQSSIYLKLIELSMFLTFCPPRMDSRLLYLMSVRKEFFRSLFWCRSKFFTDFLYSSSISAPLTWKCKHLTFALDVSLCWLTL